jgi:hypothetical protein
MTYYLFILFKVGKGVVYMWKKLLSLYAAELFGFIIVSVTGDMRNFNVFFPRGLQMYTVLKLSLLFSLNSKTIYICFKLLRRKFMLWKRSIFLACDNYKYNG